MDQFRATLEATYDALDHNLSQAQAEQLQQVGGSDDAKTVLSTDRSLRTMTMSGMEVSQQVKRSAYYKLYIKVMHENMRFKNRHVAWSRKQNRAIGIAG